MLTDVQLRHYRTNPPTKRLELAAGGVEGLICRIGTSGRITFSLRIRIPGEGGRTKSGHMLKGRKQHRFALGTYPGTTLADARGKALDHIRMVQRGENPKEELARTAAASTTVEEAVESFLSEYASHRMRVSTHRQCRYQLLAHVVYRIGPMRVHQVTNVVVSDLLGEVLRDSRPGYGGPTAANDVRKWLHRLFSWLKNAGRITGDNPVTGTERPGGESQRDRVLTKDEMFGLWQVLERQEYPFGPIVQLLALTGARRGEIANARWSWFDQDSLTIPAEHYKSNRPHWIPLSHQALTIIDKLPRHAASELFFTTTMRSPVSGFSRYKVRLDSKLADELGYTPQPWCYHDIRRTVRTGLSELSVPPHIADLCLGHKVEGVRGIYDRYAYSEERRAALEAWSELLIK